MLGSQASHLCQSCCTIQGLYQAVCGAASAIANQVSRVMLMVQTAFCRKYLFSGSCCDSFTLSLCVSADRSDVAFFVRSSHTPSQLTVGVRLKLPKGGYACYV